MPRSFILVLTLFCIVGCQSIPQFRSYRPPGTDKNLGIEVVSHDGVPVRFELRINGKFVAEMKSHLDYHPHASGVFEGRKIEMRGEFVPGRGFRIDVFVDGEQAANFLFFS